MDQPDLQFAKPLNPGEPTERRRMLDLLYARADWLSAAEILAAMGYPNTETNRRTIRKLAEDAADELISGQEGYKHVAKSTPEETSHFSNWMISQGKKMIQRGLRTQRHAHAILH